METSENSGSNLVLPLWEQCPDAEKLALLFDDLAKAQGELEGPGKDKTAEVKTKSGAKFSYSYTDLASVVAARRDVLSKHGLSVIQGHGAMQGGLLVVVTQLCHRGGGWVRTFLPMPWESDGRMSDAQAIGSASTYGRRYSDLAVTGQAPEEDDDGAGAGHKKAKPAKRKAKAKPAEEPPPNDERAQVIADIERQRDMQNVSTEDIKAWRKAKLPRRAIPTLNDLKAISAALNAGEIEHDVPF